MICTYNELKTLIQGGMIQGVDDEQINGASVDLTLGSTFWIEDMQSSGSVRLGKKETPKMIRLDSERVELKPGAFCLAQTQEVFRLPSDIAGHFMLKSSQARSGLQHLFAGFADPSWHGSVLTLEFTNVLQSHTLVLEAGSPAGQMVFWKGTSRVPPESSYAVRGQYNNDIEAQPSKGVR